MRLERGRRDFQRAFYAVLIVSAAILLGFLIFNARRSANPGRVEMPQPTANTMSATNYP